MRRESGPSLVRIQDWEGRGPWRPGFSRRWIDEASDKPLPPPLMEEFANLDAVCAKAHRQGYHIGCAFHGWQGVLDWLTPIELKRLDAFGFKFVDASTCRILLKSDHQAVIASRTPLMALPVIPLPDKLESRRAA